MQLGTRMQITIGVPDLAAELDFFLSLGYQKIEQNDQPYPSAQLSDGQNLILINQDGMTYRGLVYFNTELDALVETLEADDFSFFWKQPKDGGGWQSAMFIEPNGIDGPNGENNLGINIVANDPANLHQPDGTPLTICGRFGEFSSTTRNYAAARDFWTKLGYTVHEGGEEPYHWGVFRDRTMLLGYHQTPEGQDMASPALTYFSNNSAERIAQIKTMGHKPAFERPNDNGDIVLAGFESPGGQMIFVFGGNIPELD